MYHHLDDTICAIATAAAGAARGIVRISGPDAVGIAGQLFVAEDGQQLEQVRRATAAAGNVQLELDPLRCASNPPLAPPYERGKSLVPCDLFLWPTERSYTRQPVVELHTIGSPPLLEALLAALCRAGARLAEPGEFTLRAFLADRIDLTQAEAVLGVIDARGNDELDGALAQLAGGLARPLHQLRDDLLQLLAELEAGLDFVEDDIQFVSSQEVLARLRTSLELLESIARQMTTRHTSGKAPQVALVGPPNVGKSSLFNALVVRRATGDSAANAPSAPALVSPQCGTTRDYLTATIDLGGVACELVDTAGVDESQPDHAIARAAQAFAAEQRTRAALRACCIEASAIVADGKWSSMSCDVIVLTKADMSPRTRLPSIASSSDVPVIATSSRTGEGLDELCAALRKLLTRGGSAQPGQVVAATADRCRESIRRAEHSLLLATELTDRDSGDELIAAELRTAISELGKVVGAVYTEDLLDRIFSTFCIGK